MKKIIKLSILVAFLLQAFSCKSTQDTTVEVRFNEDVASYINNAVGFGVIFSDDWSVYTNKENSHEVFKEHFPEDKGENDSPLFFGMTNSQQEFVRCFIEETSLDVYGYFELLYGTVVAEGLVVKDAKYFKGKESIFWSYEANLGEFTIRFFETLKKSGDDVIRLCFWTTDYLYNNKQKSFIINSENSFFMLDEEWTPVWKGLYDSNNYEEIDFVEIEQDKAKDHLISEPKYLVYKVSGEKNTVYLAGSIHVGLPDFYPFPDYIEDAFNSSDYLVVEVDVTSPENIDIAGNVITMATIENGGSLDEVISPELYSKVKEEFANFGIPMENVNHLQPWFHSILLPTLQTTSMGYAEEYGVDKYFLNKAKGIKEILELETAMDQINVFKNLNDENYLAYTLLSMKKSEIIIPEMIKAWQAGDDEKLGVLIHEDYDIPLIDTSDIYSKLFTERDEKMTNQILEFLTDDKDYFVVVGSGHIVGSNGIVARLFNEGYTPEKLK